MLFKRCAENLKMKLRERLFSMRMRRGSSRVKIVALVSAILFLVFPELLPERGFAETGVAPEVTLAITPSGPLALTAEPGVFDSVTQEISVVTSNFTGYTLTLETLGTTTDLVHTQNSALTIPTIEASSEGVSTANVRGGYGWSLDGALWKSAPTPGTATVLKSTNVANSSAETTSLSFGVQIEGMKPSGTYTNEFLISAVANDAQYEVTYVPNGGTDEVVNMPTPLMQQGSISGLTLYLSTAIPRRAGYDFIGWATDPEAEEPDVPLRDLTYQLDPESGNAITFYAIWRVNECPAEYICYYGNGDDETGVMSNQVAASNSNVMLTAPNFSRPGYGFKGWNTSADGSGAFYGAQETIRVSDLTAGGLKLYAIWVAPSGILQNWTGCGSLSTNEVIGLKDFRDGEVYAVSKLADGKCWMTESMRINPATAKLSGANTNGPTENFTALAAVSASSTQLCGVDTAECFEKLQYNLNNLDRSLTQDWSSDGNNKAWYSFGGMYNWFTVTAGNGTYTKTSGSVTGDICPAGWRLPTSTGSGDFAALNNAVNSGATNSDSGLRVYPLNFAYSGDYNTNVSTGRGKQARFWSATAQSATKAYRLGYSASQVTPSNTWNKWDAFSVRCIAQTNNVALNGSIHYDANGGTGAMADDVNVNLYTASAKANGFTYDTYHVFAGWNTSADGTGTAVLDKDMVAEAVRNMGIQEGETLTLYAIWGMEATLEFDLRGGRNGPDTMYVIGQDGVYNFTIPDISPSKEDYGFVGWSLAQDATTADYVVGDTLATTELENVLYAVYKPIECGVGSICFRGNGEDAGHSITIAATSGVSLSLTAPDFSREGYGFRGWNTSADGDGTLYGPAETIKVGDTSQEGVNLYADWVESAGMMQSFSCASLAEGEVTALTDERDGETYAVGKFVDGKCWMMENLRLDLSSAEITAANTNEPTTAFLTAAQGATSTNTPCGANTEACIDSVVFNTNAINRSLTASPTTNNFTSSWFSYGVIYNWFTVTAGNGTYAQTSGAVAGDICPRGWRIPTGGASGDYAALNNAVNGGNLTNNQGLRKYPVNIIYSGDINGNLLKVEGHGTFARLWTATAVDTLNAYRFGANSNNGANGANGTTTPAGDGNYYNKWSGFPVRCVAKD